MHPCTLTHYTHGYCPHMHVSHVPTLKHHIYKYAHTSHMHTHTGMHIHRMMHHTHACSHHMYTRVCTHACMHCMYPCMLTAHVYTHTPLPHLKSSHAFCTFQLLSALFFAKRSLCSTQNCAPLHKKHFPDSQAARDVHVTCLWPMRERSCWCVFLESSLRDIFDTMPLPEPSVLPPGTWTVLVDVARMKARC